MSLPANWDDENVNADGTDGSGSNPGGVWELVVDVNARTSICCVNLPYFDREKPVQGTKPARESLVKLLTGMFNDANPLSFRREHEKDHVTLDPYYKVAPGWSTLSGGAHPSIVASPAEFAEKCIRAAACVPFIKSVTIFVIDNTNSRTQKTLDELKALNLKVQPVPNLYKKQVAAAAASSNGGGPSAAVDLGPLMTRQEKMESAMDDMRMTLNVVATLAEQVDALSRKLDKFTDEMATAAPALATTPAVAAPGDAATAEDEAPESAPRGKKRRVL